MERPSRKTTIRWYSHDLDEGREDDDHKNHDHRCNSVTRGERAYDGRVFKSLKRVWSIWDCPCGKRMVPVLRNMLAVLYKFEELEFDPEVDQKLQRGWGQPR
jgi:hypothetical protein